MAARSGRPAGWALAITCWAGLALHADDAATNSVPDPATRPLLSTNSAASTFLQLHPELAESSAAPGQSSLSLHPQAGGTNVPPEMSTPGAGIFPDMPHPQADVDDLASHLLVVYNSADPDSKRLAEYYAQKRNIPTERVLAIACPDKEEITRAQFDDTIRAPIVSYLTVKDWMARENQRVQVAGRSLDLLVATRNDIWAIVLMRGVPLKIAPDPSDSDSMEFEPALQTNAASVDSELALLPVYGLPKGGFVPNIFYDDQVSGIKRIGPDLARNMVLVTRLDGPKPDDVRRMIDDCLAAEQHRLAGLAVIDSRGMTNERDGYTMGDDWLRNARDMLVKDGWQVKFDDKPDLLPPTDPCSDVALYLGWYTADACGPWVTPPTRFVPGAIAYHLHSFSANTLHSETSNWCGPLIAHGADATMGMVYEPYLSLTPHEDIFTRRLLQGDYFAEAAYASEMALSWMLTVVGDPLYRPFHQPLDAALADAGTTHSRHDDWVLVDKVQRDVLAGTIPNTADSLKQALEVPGAGPAAEEGLGDMLAKLNDPADAEAAYQKALHENVIPIDAIRVGLKLAECYRADGHRVRQQGELQYLWARYPVESSRFAVPNPVVPDLLVPVNNAPVPRPPAPSGSPTSRPAGLPFPNCPRRPSRHPIRSS